LVAIPGKLGPGQSVRGKNGSTRRRTAVPKRKESKRTAAKRLPVYQGKVAVELTEGTGVMR